MDTILIGNIIGFVGALSMVLVGLQNKKKNILYAQNLQMVLLAISNLVLGGFTGALVNIVGIFRNCLCIKKKLTPVWIEFITMITILLSILCNTNGIVGYLPCIATLIFLFSMNIKDVIKFKYILAFVMLLWFVYDLYILSYTTAIFDIVTFFTTMVTIRQLKDEARLKLVEGK